MMDKEFLKKKTNKSIFLSKIIYSGYFKIPKYNLPKEYQVAEPLIFDEEKVGKHFNLSYDIIEKVISQKERCTKFLCKFCQRPSGYTPPNAYLTRIQMKKYAPIKLAEFYETLIGKTLNNQNEQDNIINLDDQSELNSSFN